MSGDSARRVITPPNFGPVDGPLVYLAGPIEGAPDWQSEALERLLSLDPSLNVANPRRPLAAGEELASEQIDWETGYLRRAEQHGAILFWMAAERDHVPWRAYAQIARAQLFECKARHELAGARLVLGIEENFSGGTYIRRRFEQETVGVPVFRTLEECCVAAAHLARRAGLTR